MAVRLARRFRALLEIVVLSLLAALALVVVVGVVFRWAGASLVWYDEVASILLVWLTYYGASLAALEGSHIGFPGFVGSLGPSLRRPLAWVREAVIIAFFLVVAWAGWRVLSVLGGGSLVGLPWVPTRLTQSVIPIGAILFVAAELIRLWGRPEAGGGEGGPG